MDIKKGEKGDINVKNLPHKMLYHGLPYDRTGCEHVSTEQIGCCAIFHRIPMDLKVDEKKNGQDTNKNYLARSGHTWKLG